MHALSLRTLLAIFALLLMQQGGLLHRYVHGGSGVAGALMQQSEGSAAHSGLLAHDASLCGMLDHLCTGDALVATSLAGLAPTVLAMPRPLLRAGVALVRAVPFEARAPPVILS